MRYTEWQYTEHKDEQISHFVWKKLQQTRLRSISFAPTVWINFMWTFYFTSEKKRKEKKKNDEQRTAVKKGHGNSCISVDGPIVFDWPSYDRICHIESEVDSIWIPWQWKEDL